MKDDEVVEWMPMTFEEAQELRVSAVGQLYFNLVLGLWESNEPPDPHPTATEARMRLRESCRRLRESCRRMHAGPGCNYELY